MEHSATQYGKMEEDMGEGGREENKTITIKMLPSLYPLHSTHISVLPFPFDTQTLNLLSCKHCTSKEATYFTMCSCNLGNKHALWQSIIGKKIGMLNSSVQVSNMVN